MKNNTFQIKDVDRSNIIELKPKLERNDLCYCGSGKKYKKCCMKSDQEKERTKNMLEQYEAVSDKYFSVKEYIELTGYPIIKFDLFLLEFLNITASTLYKYNKISNDKSKKIVKSLFNYSKECYSHCIDCKNNFLKTPLKNISFKSLIDRGYQLDLLPPKLQRENCMNFF